MVPTARIVAATQIVPSYLRGGANADMDMGRVHLRIGSGRVGLGHKCKSFSGLCDVVQIANF